MPLTTWTEYDALQSDALHMRDVAMGLDKPWVETAIGEDHDDAKFLAYMRAAVLKIDRSLPCTSDAEDDVLLPALAEHARDWQRVRGHRFDEHLAKLAVYLLGHIASIPPLVTYTQRFDGALASWRKPEREHDPKFTAHWTAEGGHDSHGGYERAVETWQRRNEPTLTSDANKTHDEHPARRRWVDGAACSLYIELEGKAEALLEVEPMSVQTDLIVEPQREWVEGGDSTPLSAQEFTAPTLEALRSYAVTMCVGATKAQRFVTAVGDWPMRAVRDTVAEQVDAARKAQRARPAKLDVNVTRAPSRARALTTYRLRDRVLTGTPRQIRVKQAQRDLMPMQRPVVWHAGLPAFDEHNPKRSVARRIEVREAQENANVCDVAMTRLYAEIRLADYRSKRYRPLRSSC